MKISISTYSFNRMLQNGEITQFDCIAKAKEMGFEGIEFVDILPHDSSSIEDYARKLNAECKRVGLTITNYTVGADLLKDNQADIQKEIERIKGQVDIAHILGATSMRHDATGGYPADKRGFRGFNDALPMLSSACREITTYAKTKGIKTMVENHGFFAQDSERVERLINMVADDNFGWLCDIGNFVCADENPATATGRAAPYAFYAHAKDFHIKNGMLPNPGEGFFKSRGGNYLRGAIIGHGDIPIQQCIGILQSGGYDGFIAIEFEGMEENITAISIGLSNLKRYIQNA